MLKKISFLLLTISLSLQAVAGVFESSEESFDFEKASAELYAPIDVEQENTEKQKDCSVITPEEKASILLIPDEISKTSQNLDLQDEAVTTVKNLGGKWAFEFMWVPHKGDAVIMDAFNERIGMIPASIVKIFPGWMAYDYKTKPNAFLSHMLRKSDNAQAKQTLVSLGGIDKLKEYYAALNWFGIFSPVDGSGYCIENKISAHVFNLQLKNIYDSEKYNGFKKLLAQPFADGTLSRRLQALKGKLFAKTGTMGQSGIISLAGFYEGAEGTMIFTVMVNSMKSGPKTTRSQLDALLARHVLYVNRE